MNLTSSLVFRKYEKTPDIQHGDVVFYHFQQKIRYAPDQIIRSVLSSIRPLRQHFVLSVTIGLVNH